MFLGERFESVDVVQVHWSSRGPLQCHEIG
jgi:hypothetical protein